MMTVKHEQTEAGKSLHAGALYRRLNDARFHLSNTSQKVFCEQHLMCSLSLTVMLLSSSLYKDHCYDSCTSVSKGSVKQTG